MSQDIAKAIRKEFTPTNPLAVSVSGGSGGGGDASAENQTLEIQKLNSIDSKTTNDPATATKQQELITIDSALRDTTYIIRDRLPSGGVLSEGTDITGVSIPTGGSGGRGWLSAIWKTLTDRVPVLTLIGDRLKTQSVLDSVTVTGSANAENGMVIPSTDCSSYSFLSLQLTGTWSGIVTFEFSNDNINWINGILYALNTAAPPNTLTTLNSIYYGNKQGRYFRARVSTYSSGTVNGTLSLSSSSTTPAFPVITISGTPNVNLATVNNSSPDIASQTTLSVLNNKLSLADDRLKVNTVGASLDLTGSGNSNTIVIPSTDITDYSWVGFQLSGTWVASVLVEFSNNNTAWQQGLIYNVNIGATLPSATLNGVYTLPKQGKFFRISIFNYVSGTVNINVNCSNNNPSTLPVQTITFNGVMPVSLPANYATSTLQTSILNRLMPAGNSTSVYTSIGAVSSTLQNGITNLFAVYAINSASIIRYIQFFNTTSIPATGTVPSYVFPLPPNNGLLLLGQDVLGGQGINFNVGLTFGISTTLTTYTPGSATDAVITFRYL